MMVFQRFTPWLFWVSLAALLGGCASQQPLGHIDNWNDYQKQLAVIEDWQLAGKIGFRLQTTDGNNSGSANFNWQQQSPRYNIRLYGPFGQGSTWIKSDGQNVELQQAGKPDLQASSPEELMYRSLGWWLPIKDLSYWIKGIPAPHSPIISQSQTEQGTLQQLQQSGWQLSYSRYQQVNDWQLPGKLVAERDNIRLTLIIKDWVIKD